MALAASLGFGQQPSPPASPDPRARAVVESLLAAPDAEARAAVLAGVPEELRGAPLRVALLEAARARLAGGQTAVAEVAYATAQQLAEQAGDGVGLAAVLNGRANLLRRRGDYEGGLELLRRAEALFTAAGDAPRVAAALNNQAVLHRFLGDYDRALALYQRALDLSREQGNGRNVAMALNNIGVVLSNRGDHRRALDHFQRSLAGTAEDDPFRADIFANIGDLFQAQGSYGLAADHYRRALETHQRASPGEVPYDQAELGLLALIEGRLDEAERWFREAFAGAEKAEDASVAGDVLAHLGALALARGQPQQAHALYTDSRARAEATGDPEMQCSAATGQARAALATSHAAEAAEAARHAADLAERLDSPRLLWPALSALGHAQLSLGRDDEARRAFEGAVAAIEDWRQRVVGGEEQRQAFLEDKLEPYHALLDLLAASGRFPEALACAERARARTLSDVLEGGRVRLAARLGEAERGEERALERQLLQQHARRAAAGQARGAPAEIRAHDDAIQEARRALAAFQVRAYAARPELGLARGAAPPVSLADVAPLIDARTAALVYAVTPARVHLFVLTRDPGAPDVRLEHHLLSVAPSDLARRVEAFRRQLAARDLDFSGAAQRLYADLLGPARRRLAGRTRLVLLPDAALWALPFAALAPRPGRSLVEQAALWYAPSLTALRILEAKAPLAPAERTLLAVGNPTLTSDHSGSLPPLADAERQVQALRRVYGPGASRILVRAEAGEERVRAEAGRFGTLHFATHARIDDRSPLFSYLLMAGSGEDAERDGRLEAREVLDLQLSASLVVLSACETGLGRQGAGEGTIGLSWAFALAGSPNVVASHWKVDAASTTALMTGFHARLQRAPAARADVAEALRQASLALRRDPRYRHPFYWAGFFLTGRGGL
jgi:CHAT domain-containing protein/Tfp pilus assembly protein PilF